MAISRFQGERTNNLSTLFNWLNANKSGTFLENLTITNTTTVNTNDKLSIADDEVTIRFTVQSGKSAECFKFLSADWTQTRYTANATGTIAYIVGAILCNKGLLLKYDAMNYNGQYIVSYAVGVTIDNDGKLAAIVTAPESYIPPSNTSAISQWIAITSKTIAENDTACRPYFGANLTSLAPITTMAIDTNALLPYAYAAISTQLNSEGLSPVIIDGAPYITNGVWYIKDGD